MQFCNGFGFPCNYTPFYESCKKGTGTCEYADVWFLGTMGAYWRAIRTGGHHPSDAIILQTEVNTFKTRMPSKKTLFSFINQYVLRLCRTVFEHQNIRIGKFVGQP